jgi:tetratricopeptide (TPR) repeat protein
MLKKYIGAKRKETLDWLVGVWLKEGPPVCFLQGFPGVGKTDLARDFRELAEKQGEWQRAVINEIADRPTPSVIGSLTELSLLLSRQGLPEMERAFFEERVPNLASALERTPNPAFALEKALRRPVVIILDEAQRFFTAKSGAPPPEMIGILDYLRNRPNLRGRLLLLTDRIVEEARWSEWIPKRTLNKLEPDEAIEAFDTKLKEAEVRVEIPAGRLMELVRDLDYNPRAIEALVSALRYESLDEIIGSNPGLWAVRDREVSREFLEVLERDLMSRTLRHLDEVHIRRLRKLAVHRRSFKREALEKICRNKDEVSELRAVLTTRFLLNFYKGEVSVNPIVKEISLAHLRNDPAAFRQAHASAAEYHMRHFKAKQIVGSHSKLGGSFAELRYHLTQAGRLDELTSLSHRFTDHLKLEINSGSPVPSDREELDERIGVLAILLGNGGAKGLEYHLARCLTARGHPGDLERAIQHAELAVGRGASEEAWLQLIRLKARTAGIDAALPIVRAASAEMGVAAAPVYRLGADILGSVGRTEEAAALLRDGIAIIPPERGAFSLYQACADLLALAGRVDEAVALLGDGIKVIPPEQSAPLYQACADLLAVAHRTEEAMALLQVGIKVIPPEQSVPLYRACANLLTVAGRIDEAVALLRDGIKAIPPARGAFSLYQACADVLARAGRIDEAVALLQDGIRVVPREQGVPLYQACADLLAGSGRTGEATALLQSGIKAIPPARGAFSLYQACADLLAGSGRADEAMALLRGGIRVIPAEQSAPLYQACADLLAVAGRTDEAMALLQVGIKVIPPSAPLSQACADLLAGSGRGEEAMTLLQEGIRVIPAEQSAPLYQACADLLARSGRTDEAVALLRDRIKVIPPAQGAFSLYQVADLLARTGQTDEAVTLLRDGIKVIPPEQSVSLYQSLATLFCSQDRADQAVSLLREGLRNAPRASSRGSLELALINIARAGGSADELEAITKAVGAEALSREKLQLAEAYRCADAGDVRRAFSILATARAQFPHDLHLAAAEAFCCLVDRNPSKALDCLTSVPREEYRKIQPLRWLEAFIHVRREDIDSASEAVASLVGRPIAKPQEVTEAFLLRLWDQQETAQGSQYICGYFPVLPPQLSGGAAVVRRLPFAKPALSWIPAPVSAPPLARSTSPDVYVSYAWGEDTSEAGRQREEIVDRLCAAVADSGLLIGRDKERMHGGDSIERFAQEISRAARIVAIISEKSLNSQFCMAHELFRAFRRCDYQRVEFQEKVVALVMDDAKDIFKDNLSIIALAKTWRMRAEELRRELQSIDPERKSADLWVFLDLLEDMCPRLPAMLAALQDIVMKRGFNEIVKDGFREVIARLRPRAPAS